MSDNVYVTVTLRVKKLLVNEMFAELPRIVNDNEFWFASCRGEAEYDLLHEEDWSDSCFDRNTINYFVENELHEMDMSSVYSSFREDDPNKPYEHKDVRYEDALFLKDGKTRTINNMSDMTSLSGCIVKVPIYKKEIKKKNKKRK